MTKSLKVKRLKSFWYCHDTFGNELTSCRIQLNDNMLNLVPLYRALELSKSYYN